VLFPAFAKLQDDRLRMATNYRRITFVNALVLLPASAVLIVLGPEMIRILMGAGWDSAVLPFQILAVSMFMRTSQRLGAIVATAGGLAGAIAIAYTLYTIAVIVGALLSVRWGLPGVATSTAVALVVCYGACSAPALRYSGLSLGSFLAAHVPGLVVSGLLLLVLWPAAGLLRDVSTTPIVFGVIVAAAAIVALVTIGVALRARYGDFAWLRDELERVIRKRRPQA
jgi:O-antigen/teichoic acid export membrane protein